MGSVHYLSTNIGGVVTNGEALPPSTFEAYLQGCYEGEARAAIAARTMTRAGWRLWRRYKYTGSPYQLMALALLLDLGRTEAAARRIMRGLG